MTVSAEFSSTKTPTERAIRERRLRYFAAGLSAAIQLPLIALGLSNLHDNPQPRDPVLAAGLMAVLLLSTLCLLFGGWAVWVGGGIHFLFAVLGVLASFVAFAPHPLLVTLPSSLCAALAFASYQPRRVGPVSDER